MKHMNVWVLFVLFTIIYGSLFKLCCSVLPPVGAFLSTTVLIACAAIGLGLYSSIKEGMNHRTRFTAMKQDGIVTMEIPNTTTSKFTFANYILNGTADGAINAWGPVTSGYI